ASWSWSAIDGSDSDRRMKVDQSNHKEFLYKEAGEYQLTLTVTNALGRTSDPYILPFSVIPDYAPAVIAYPYASQISRNEALQLYYDGVSTDGDLVKNLQIQVYYDVANDESYSQLVDTFTSAITQYTPPAHKLGKYRMVFTLDEDFGQ